MGEKIKGFIKDEVVLFVAAILAIASAFVVTPGKEYIEYIDFKTLTILFCLMAVVAGLQEDGAFDCIAQKVLTKVGNTRQLSIILVVMCFLSSMFITNDVALITFVPFTMLIFTKAEHKEMIIYTVVMQTIAANLGSMLLPVGNPQNLYLFGKSDMSFLDFVGYMAPLWIVSFILIIIAMIPVKKHKLLAIATEKQSLSKTPLYIVLFAICLCTVAGILKYYYLLAIIFVAIVIFDRKILKKVDYMLLITFVCFFIFIGNMKNVSQVARLLEDMIQGRELAVGIISSQVISNVPAAILLSGFTDNIKALLWGTDIGGLGTLIASMASLISYKIYVKQDEHDGKKYFLVFTGMNLLFLAAIIMFVVLFS